MRSDFSLKTNKTNVKPRDRQQDICKPNARDGPPPVPIEGLSMHDNRRAYDKSAFVQRRAYYWSMLVVSREMGDLHICSPWTFRENHSPNIIYTVNRRNQPTAMDLHFLDWVRTRTRDAHKISPHGTMTKRTPAMNWDHAVSWGGGLG